MKIEMPIIGESNDTRAAHLAEALHNRFHPKMSGLLIDQIGHPEPHWFIGADEFELFIGKVEDIVQLTLGRRLAHAAAESEEWRLSAPEIQPPKPLFSRRAKQLQWVADEWSIRSHGELVVMSEDGKETTLLVRNRSHPSLAAGMAAAVWEKLAERRQRFRWSDGGAGESLITLERDNRQIPVAIEAQKKWIEERSNDQLNDELKPLYLATDEGSGAWSVDGVRMLSISQDLVLRFCSSILPFLADHKRILPIRCEWIELDDEQSVVLWDALAQAMRQRFLERGEIVLVAEPEHWLHVGSRYLARCGLGAIKSAEPIGELGEVRLRFDAMYHPAMVVGVLLAAWERAHARPARAKWINSEGAHTVEIFSLHDVIHVDK